jgi:hypothetical protein
MILAAGQDPGLLAAVHVPVAAAAGRVDDRGVLVDADHRGTRGRTRRGPGGQVGRPGPHPVEVRQDAQPRQHAEPGLRCAGWGPDGGDPVGERDRPRGAAGQRRAGPPGRLDGGPDPGAAQGPGQELRVAAGQVDQPGAVYQGGQVRGSGLVTVPDHHGNLLHAETFGLRGAQVEPVLQPVRPLGGRRGRDLDVTGRASLDQGAFDTRHDGQVLTAADQRQRARSRMHGPTVAEPLPLPEEPRYLRSPVT